MKYLLVLAVVLLTACQKNPEQSSHQGNFNVEKLFTYEGCTVYRFQDDRTVYYTNCQGQTQQRYSCGKNCSRDDLVTTEVVR